MTESVRSTTGCIAPLDLLLVKTHQCTVKPLLSVPRFPDFLSSPNFVMNIIILDTIKIRSSNLFKTTALKNAVTKASLSCF